MKKLILLLVCLFLWSPIYAYDGEELWMEIQMLCNIESDDPLYPSAQRINIFNAAVGIIDQVELANKQIDTLALSANLVEYDLGSLNTSLYVRDIVAIRFVETGEFLRKISVADVNKYSRSAIGIPKFFYFWTSIVGFAPPPSVSSNAIIYWANTHKWFTAESSVFYGIPYYNSALLFNAAALYQQRRGNMAGYQNLMGIAQSMVSDLAQIEQMIKDTKDIIFLPEVYEE